MDLYQKRLVIVSAFLILALMGSPGDSTLLALGNPVTLGLVDNPNAGTLADPLNSRGFVLLVSVALTQSEWVVAGWNFTNSFTGGGPSVPEALHSFSELRAFPRLSSTRASRGDS